VYYADQDVELSVNLTRVSKIPTDGSHTPKFPKKKEEGKR
jgi:hypothetical protein